ncbi:MAG: RlmE family RNA methyltransferase [Gammaproteobacteria bacterium]
MTKKGSSSNRWIDRHLSDKWVQQAQVDGYRSRASYKLIEIDQRDRLFRGGSVVVDLGAAPGGWSQVASRRLKGGGQVIALDLLAIEPMDGVNLIRGDFRDQAVLDELLDLLEGQPVDLVMSDMAPNISGIKAVDQPAMLYLVELALDFSRQVLKPGGKMLVKTFEGAGMAPYRQQVKESFERVVMRKPDASRDSSAEQYLLATGFRG